MVVVSAGGRLPRENKGKNPSGRPAVAGGAGVGVGTICGDAGRDFRSMISEPMRITPALKFVLARSIDKPLSVNVANGVSVPAVVQSTINWAGTDGSVLMVNALKSGGAEPKGVMKPLIHSGPPTTGVPVTTAEAVFTAYAPALTGPVPLPVKL